MTEFLDGDDGGIKGKFSPEVSVNVKWPLNVVQDSGAEFVKMAQKFTSMGQGQQELPRFRPPTKISMPLSMQNHERLHAFEQAPKVQPVLTKER